MKKFTLTPEAFQPGCTDLDAPSPSLESVLSGLKERKLTLAGQWCDVPVSTKIVHGWLTDLFPGRRIEVGTPAVEYANGLYDVSYPVTMAFDDEADEPVIVGVSS